MSNEGIDRQQQKINDFLRLLPLTAAIAGLPNANSAGTSTKRRWNSAP